MRIEGVTRRACSFGEDWPITNGRVCPTNGGIMAQVATARLNAGERFPERRAAPRFDFDAHFEIVDPLEQTKIAGRVTVISQKGCFALTQEPFNQRGVVRTRIRKDDSVFETWAWATPSRPDSDTGVVLVFMDTPPEQSKVLEAWLSSLAAR